MHSLKHTFLLILFTSVFGIQLNAQKIELNPSMLLSKYKSPNAIKLLDEQILSGDPLTNPASNPIEFWNTGSAEKYPVYVVIDLKTTFKLNAIALRDSYNEGTFEIYSGRNGNWRKIVSDPLTGLMQWNVHEVDAETQYLRLQKNEPGANVAEVILYGKPLGVYGAPKKITDLSAQWISDSEVFLQWTAPASNISQVSGYDIRYDNQTVTDSAFYLINNYSGIIDLVRPGQKQSVIIKNLEPQKKYYFALKSFDSNNIISELSNVATANPKSRISEKKQRINLSPDMVLNEHAQGNAKALVDEQHLIGMDALDRSVKPKSQWKASVNQWMFPCYALIDLKGFYHVKEIYLHDAWSKNTKQSYVKLYHGEPFEWEYFATDSMHQNDKWSKHLVDIKTRYIRIALHSADSRINEIALYGTKIADVEGEVKLKSQHILPKPTLGDMLGINAFASDPIGLLEVSTFVREYHDWFWSDGNAKENYPGYPDNRLEFNTMGIDFDLFYKNLQNMGIGVVPCIQHGVPYLYDGDMMRMQEHPVYTGQNPEDPKSYIAHADFMYQYAARYGSQKISKDKLKLEKGQKLASGLRLVRYFENYNEHDKWWKGKNAFFTPYQFMAMTSADYDGHLRTLGNNVGIKNADPQAKLVMSGLASPHLDYVKAMKLWADKFRGGQMPIDVINIHHYCGNQKERIGISPEADNLRGRLEEFVEYRNRVMPEKEVWLSEFGYDTNNGSPQQAPAIGPYSSDEVQAMWLVRSVLEMAASGIDKGMMYMLRDVSNTDSIRYNSSGLVRSKHVNYEPKPAWYYYATLKNNLSDMVFQKEMETNRDDVKVYRFYSAKRGLSAYAIWCPSSKAHTVNSFNLKLLPGEVQAQQIRLIDKNKNGYKSTMLVANGNINLQVSEIPVFIIAANENHIFKRDKVEKWLKIKPEWVTENINSVGAKRMVNEQDKVGKPLEGKGGLPEQGWEPGYSVRYPVHAYIDLQKKREVAKIALYDTNGSGLVTFSIGRPGHWIEIAREDLKSYNTWKTHIIDKSTQYLRITKHSADAKFNEIAVFIKE